MSVGPFWRYFGGKWRAAPIYPAPPKGVTIVEPFAGAAGYSCRYPDRDVVLVDASADVVETWRWLISATRSDVLALPPTLERGVSVDSLGLAPGATMLLRWWCNNGASSPCRTPSVWASAAGWHAGIRARIAADVAKIRHWRVIHGDYREAPDVDAWWFIDPPYAGPAGSRYPHGSGAIDHTALGAWCRSRRGAVVVCEGAGADWLPFESVGSIKASAGARRAGKSQEVVWTRDCDMARLAQGDLL